MPTNVLADTSNRVRRADTTGAALLIVSLWAVLGLMLTEGFCAFGFAADSGAALAVAA